MSSNWRRTLQAYGFFSLIFGATALGAEESIVPRRIAVLPAQGDATPEHKEDIRTAVHNNLSSKSFELMKPYKVDEILATLKQTEGLLVETTSPETLAKKLDVDGLLFIDVPAVSKVYIGAYAQQMVEAKFKLFVHDRQAFIWEKASTETEREGGISLNLLSMLATAVTSSFVLSDGVRRTLIDRLARSATAEIPTPVGSPGMVAPPRIETVISNAFEGPFRAGDEVKLVMKAEPGLVVSFDLGSRIGRQKIEEKAAGEYFGRYVVQEGDNAERLLLTVQAMRPRDRATLEWRVPGRISLDTVAPSAVGGLSGRPVREGLRLSWNPPASADRLRFVVEKADAAGVFKTAADLEVGEWLDPAVESGKSYYYRVTAVDAAKNRSVVVQQKVNHVAAGPTRVSGDLAEDATWYAFASPYQIDGPLRILPSATLHLEPGVVIEFLPKASLEVLGRLDAAGTADGVIQLKGPEWSLAIKSAVAPGNRMAHVQMDGAQGAVVVNGGRLSLNDVTFNGMANALIVDGAAELDLERVVIERATVGLALNNGRVRAQDLRLAFCDTALLFDRQGLVSSRRLVLDRNLAHARAQGGSVSLDDVRFSETDYVDLMARLHGVRVNWSSIPDDRNLRNRWLDGKLKGVATELVRKSWGTTLDSVEALDEAVDGGLAALCQALHVLAGQPSTAQFALADVVQQVEREHPGSAVLLLQEASTPYRAQLAEGFLINQTKARFALVFLDAFYPQRLLQGGAWTGKLATRIRASHLLWSQRAGALQRYWVVHLIDGAAVEQDLLLAGAIARESSVLKLGLLNASEHPEALQRLSETLNTHKVGYVSLGQGVYGAPMRLKAQDLGVNLVLELTQTVRVQDSELSASLKQIEAKLNLAIHDVDSDRALNRFSTQANGVDFRGAAGLGKVVGEAYGKIEAEMVRALWAAATSFEQRQAANVQANVQPAQTVKAGVEKEVGSDRKPEKAP